MKRFQKTNYLIPAKSVFHIYDLYTFQQDLLNNSNNNDKEVSYKLILKVNEEEAILESLRVGADDLFIDDLLNLAKYEDGYIVGNYTLEPGYTKIHNVKMWYRLDVDHTIAVDTVDYSLELVRE